MKSYSKTILPGRVFTITLQETFSKDDGIFVWATLSYTLQELAESGLVTIFSGEYTTFVKGVKTDKGEPEGKIIAAELLPILAADWDTVKHGAYDGKLTEVQSNFLANDWEYLADWPAELEVEAENPGDYNDALRNTAQSVRVDKCFYSC